MTPRNTCQRPPPPPFAAVLLSWRCLSRVRLPLLVSACESAAPTGTTFYRDVALPRLPVTAFHRGTALPTLPFTASQRFLIASRPFAVVLLSRHRLSPRLHRLSPVVLHRCHRDHPDPEHCRRRRARDHAAGEAAAAPQPRAPMENPDCSCGLTRSGRAAAEPGLHPDSAEPRRVAGGASRRRDCHFAGAPSASPLKRLLKGEGGTAE